MPIFPTEKVPILDRRKCLYSASMENTDFQHRKCLYLRWSRCQFRTVESAYILQAWRVPISDIESAYICDRESVYIFAHRKCLYSASMENTDFQYRKCLYSASISTDFRHRKCLYFRQRKCQFWTVESAYILQVWRIPISNIESAYNCDRESANFRP